MEGGAVSEVVSSNLPGYAAQDIVVARTGWQKYSLSDGQEVQKVDPGRGTDLVRTGRARGCRVSPPTRACSTSANLNRERRSSWPRPQGQSARWWDRLPK